MIKKCTICPHKCEVDRTTKMGRCKAGDKIEIGGVSLHMFEEPCISGKNGSGTIFFSKCNLNCVFCQNYEISNIGKGKKIEIEELAEIFLKQQENKAENINLVSPTIYAYKIKEAVEIARNKGLKIPIIYNTNGFERVETLKELEGTVDVYLPDLKYYDNSLGEKYSKINNYFEITTQAIKEMYRQVGNPKFDERGMIKKGIIIRHLVLPNHIENTKKVLEWINKNMDKNVYVSIMTQYFPTYKAKEYQEINRKITKEEYEKIENYIYELGIENGYMQDYADENEEQYVPVWNYT